MKTTAALLAAALLLLGRGQLAAQRFIVTDLGDLGGGVSVPSGINNAGQRWWAI